MPYGETKVYYDGSHYIAIPHSTRITKKRPKKIEEKIFIPTCNNSDVVSEEDSNTQPITLDPNLTLITDKEILSQVETVFPTEKNEKITKNTQKMPKNAKILTKKEYFNELYKENISLKKKDRKQIIIKKMLKYFSSFEDCKKYVEEQFERKQRNLICRRVRMVRKANLAGFNYFVTFTYDDKKHNEFTFKKKLQSCFKMLCHRKGWQYMGVWERAPETNRLHFHGLFKIPDGSMVGTLEEHNDYSLNSHKRQTTLQNTYFNEKFGRSDFHEINHHADLMQEIGYIMKYLEKTDEKIVYSKGLYQYFISDIMDEDVITTCGQEDKKLVLFDDFNCWDEGCLMGKVSPEVISQMRKSN